VGRGHPFPTPHPRRRLRCLDCLAYGASATAPPTALPPRRLHWRLPRSITGFLLVFGSLVTALLIYQWRSLRDEGVGLVLGFEVQSLGLEIDQLIVISK